MLRKVLSIVIAMLIAFQVSVPISAVNPPNNVGDCRDTSFNKAIDSFGAVCTPYRKKCTPSSVFLDLRGSDFKAVGVIRVAIFGRNSKGQEANCTYKADCYFLEAGKKYELYNTVLEHPMGFDEAQIRIQGYPGQQLSLRWSPDYDPDPECLRIGDNHGTVGNTSDRQFCFVVLAPQKYVFSPPRTKANDTSVFLELNPSPKGPVKVSIYGLGGNIGSENCTNSPSKAYVLEPGKKYELFNLVKENGHSAVQLKFMADADTYISGRWSPDYTPESGCIVAGKTSTSTAGVPMRNASAPQVLVNVPTISQLGAFPTGCESVSATMLLNYYGYKVSVDDVINQLCKRKVFRIAGTLNGPDPNSAFVGDPHDAHSYGCFAPCIAKAMNKIMKGEYTAKVVSGESLESLCGEYISNKKPVLIWVTMGMCKTVPTTKWKIGYVDENAKYKIGEDFIWPGNEHCVVLTGFNDTTYFVNDPLKPHDDVRYAYDKSLLAERYREQGLQAVVIATPTRVSFFNTGDNLGNLSDLAQCIVSFYQGIMSDGREAHKTLQEHFLSTYGEFAHKEVVISSGVRFNVSGIGKVDMMYCVPPRAEFYEIKPNSHHVASLAVNFPEIWQDIASDLLRKLSYKLKKLAGRNLGSNQLEEYVIAARGCEDFKVKYKCTDICAGTTYSHPRGLVLERKDSSGKSFMYTTYYENEQGMIYWIYFNTKKGEPTSAMSRNEQIATEMYKSLRSHSREIVDKLKLAYDNQQDYVMLGNTNVAISAIMLALLFVPAAMGIALV